MGKDVIVMLLGVWVGLLPFLGFPSSWDRILFLISGIILISVGISMRRAKTASREHNTDAQVSRGQHDENTH